MVRPALDITNICALIGSPLATIGLHQRRVGDQIAQFAAAQPDREVAPIDIDEQPGRRDDPGQQGRGRGAGDAHAWERPDASNT